MVESRTRSKLINIIRFEKDQGLKLARASPEIAQNYRENETHREIAVKYQVKEKYGANSEDIAAKIVRWGLKELMSEDEYRKVSIDHLADSGTANLKNMSVKKRKSRSRAAIRGCGYTPWEPHHLAFIWLMSGDETLLIDSGENRRIDHHNLATIANNYLHRGRKIRTPIAIKTKLNETGRNFKRIYGKPAVSYTHLEDQVFQPIT